MTPARYRLLIVSLIVLGILFAGFFGMRSLRAFREFRSHRPPPLLVAESQQTETNPDLIRGWMTIPYISVTYNVHPRALFEALNVPPHGNEEKSIEDLNHEYYPEAPGIVLEMVKAAVRANQPVPTASLPLTPHPPLSPIPANP